MMAEEYCSVHGWNSALKRWELIQSARTYFEVDMILSSRECRKYFHFKVSREVPVNVQEWRQGIEAMVSTQAKREQLQQSISAESKMGSCVGEHNKGTVASGAPQSGGPMSCPWDE